VRLTLGACVLSVPWAQCLNLNECLCAATRSLGSCIRYMLPSSKNNIQEGPVRCGAARPLCVGQPAWGEPGGSRSLACTGPPALSFRLPVLPIELAEDVGMGPIQAPVGSGVGSGAGFGLPPSSSFRQASGLVRDPDQLLCIETLA
jgi:hypothetical protein